MLQEVSFSILIVAGSLFVCIAGLGILRMPDLFMRMSTATKASTLGSGFLIAAVAIKYPALEIATRSLAIIVFLFLTAPVAAHIIGRAAYIIGVPLWKGSVTDELCEYYDRCSPYSDARIPDGE